MSSIRLMSLALLASGCAAHLRPHPELGSSEGAKVPMRAVILQDPEIVKKVDAVGSFNSLSGSYAFDTGEMVFPKIREIASQVFEQVSMVDNAKQAGLADVMLVVKDLSVKHPGRADDFSLRFDFKLVGQKPSGGLKLFEVSYSETIQAVRNTTDSHVALTAPVEKGIALALGKLANDMRRELGAPVVLPPDQALAAGGSAGSGDFSDFPPPPPPPSEVTSQSVAAAPPPPPPTSASTAPSFSSTPQVKQTAPSASRGGPNLVLVGAGAVLLAAGYTVSPAIAYAQNLPGDNSLMFIPVAGPLLVALQNPFFNGDSGVLAMTLAATAGQVLGLGLIAAGFLTGGSSGSGGGFPVAQGWSVLPTAGPSSIGVSVTTP